MTIEEKLQHFYDSTVEEAKKQANESLKVHSKALEKMLEEHKEARLKSAEEELKAQTENAKREVNKALSAQQLTMKRDWTKKQEELKDKLFVEVKDRLAHFMDTPQYEKFLYRRIMEAKKYAGEDEVDIYLSSGDSSCQRALIAQTGLPVKVSDEPFMGGIKAIIPGKNILIDHSFLEIFQTLQKEFKFDGGLRL